MLVFKRYIFIVFLFISFVIKPCNSKLDKGFEALRLFDYFNAKIFFYQINKKKINSFSCYGLATLFSRSNNPFFNNDSALKYANLSYNLFDVKSQSYFFLNFEINQKSIVLMIDSLATRNLINIKKQNNLQLFDVFLKNNYLANEKILTEAVFLRDQIEFNELIKQNNIDSTNEFMISHPLSEFYSNSFLLREKQIFEQKTSDKTSESYLTFIQNYPTNSFKNNAFENLFKIYKADSDLKGLYYFIKNFPNATQNLEACKLLFNLSVKIFSQTELNKFLLDYPDFPQKETIFKELELNKLILYPYQVDGLYGFIDSKLNICIRPIYDVVSLFYEGYATVIKNDSAFFINKLNENIYGKYYSEAFVFRNGIAPVKIDTQWYFINRQHLKVSKYYTQINEISDDVYVVKLNEKYGALNQFGESLIEPKFEFLGDFKNGLSIFIDNGKYGFVSKSGFIYQAQFDWISDFNSDRVAIFRINNKFGLINSEGKILLESKYDQILTASNSIYLPIVKDFYGFYSSKNCFLTSISFRYIKEKPVQYYTNGFVFKLIKKNQEALMDENGSLIIKFGEYDEFNFLANELMRVRKDTKYGYLNKQNQIALPFIYDKATDFMDSLATVKINDTYFLINNFGEIIYSSQSMINKFSTHYFQVNISDKISILNSKGQLIFNNVSNIQKVNANLFIITKLNSQLIFLSD